MSLERREVRFAVSPDAAEVSGVFLRPEKARVVLVLGHGAGAGMRHRFMEGIAEALSGENLATLRYQFPYKEEGRRRPDRTSRLVATVRAATREAAVLAGDLPLFAAGKSMGGRMTSIAQAEDPLPGVAGMVFFGFPLHRPGDLSDSRADHLQSIRVPMLFVQGTRDRLAEIDRIKSVVHRLGGRAAIRVIEDADHGFDVLKRTGLSSAEVYAAMARGVAAWVSGLGP